MILPKDTKILPNNLTEQLIAKSKLLNIPSYANGVGINTSLMDLIKNMPSILPNISLQSFKPPQFQPSISSVNNFSPTLNITTSSGTTKGQIKEITDVVQEKIFKEFAKMLKK